jgi:hypothetical protein
MVSLNHSPMPGKKIPAKLKHNAIVEALFQMHSDTKPLYERANDI